MMQQGANGLKIRYGQHPLTRRQVTKILKEAARADGPAGLRDYAILTVLYVTCMHVQELVSLNVDQLNLVKGDGYAQCYGKNSRKRMVPFNNDVVQIIESYITEGRPALVRNTDEPAVFVNKVNRRGTSIQRLTRQACWTISWKYAELAGISNPISPSVLRHSRAIHMLEHGDTLREVQERLGYTNMGVTNRAYRQQ
jgi:integrase/recombinase XerD